MLFEKQDDELEMETITANIRQDRNQAPSRKGVHLMFDRIARRYDLLNHLLSAGLDIRWRRKAVEQLPQLPGVKILDLACGTGDLAIAAAKRLGRDCHIVGVDLAEKMLAIGRHKIAARGLDQVITLQSGDGMALSFAEHELDAVMIAFGIRNMPDSVGCLREICRVLKPGGRLVVLEFSLPANWLMRTWYLFYFRYVLPLVGTLVSGDGYAYRYLNRTVETYEHGEAFLDLMCQAGFAEVRQQRLSAGIASIYVGDKQ
ncbi:MAG: bifunctional demethylmenaquinone methyltransferase/2-methoxy-6-polyprenyl-1,4-benzoquinol methylase UbiE [bacterium]